MSKSYPADLDSYNYGDYDDGYADGLAGRYANPPDPDEPSANEAYRAGYDAGQAVPVRRTPLSADDIAKCVALIQAERAAWEALMRQKYHPEGEAPR